MQENVMIVKDRLNKVMDQLAGTGLWPEQSKIRLAQPIKAGKGQYIFNLKEGGDGLSTFALDRNDVFIPNYFGVLLELVNDTTGVKKVYSFAPIADGENPSVYAAGFIDDQIEKMYAGHMQWLLDNQVMMAAYPMENFHYVPETQGAFVLNSSDEAVNEGIQVERDIYKMLSLVLPKYVIAGTRDHKITINFDAAGNTFECTEGYTANIVLYLDGMLVKGGSEYKGGGASNPFGEAVGQW
jgi:hypothetical protein